MEIVKLGNKESLQCPTIVKIRGDYYLVSKKYYPNSLSNSKCCKAIGLDNPVERYIAINLNDGKWFDWGSDIPCLNLEMETFEKGTKLEITI